MKIIDYVSIVYNKLLNNLPIVNKKIVFVIYSIKVKWANSIHAWSKSVLQAPDPN